MKSRKSNLRALSAVFCAVCLLLSGCGKDSASFGQESTSLSEASAASTEDTSVNSSFPEGFDETAFLNHYIYPSFILCRTPFSSPEELSKGTVLQYCYNRMIMEAEPLESAPDNEMSHAMCTVSEKLLAEYAEKTFGLKNFDFSERYNYDAQKKAYLLEVQTTEQILQSFSIMKVLSTEREDNRLVVTTQWSDDGFPLTNFRYSFVPNGADFRLESLTSTDVSGKQRKLLSDKAILLNEILDMPIDDATDVRAWSVTGNRALLSVRDYWQTRSNRLGYVNVDTGKSEKWVVFPYNAYFYSYPSGIVVKSEKEIAFYDTDLNLTKTINLPDEINNEEWENRAYPAASPDGKRLVYSNTDGVYLYDVKSKESRLLFEHANAHPENEVAIQQYGIDGFSTDSSKIICKLYGYEWVIGYRIYDFATDTYTDFKTSQDIEIGPFTDLCNDKIIYFEDPTRTTTEDPPPEYNLYQYSLADGTTLKQSCPSQMLSMTTTYMNDCLFTSTRKFLPGLPIEQANAHQYDISKNEASTFSEEIKDSTAILDILAKSANEKLLVQYYQGLESGFAIVDAKSGPFTAEE